MNFLRVAVLLNAWLVFGAVNSAILANGFERAQILDDNCEGEDCRAQAEVSLMQSNVASVTGRNVKIRTDSVTQVNASVESAVDSNATDTTATAHNSSVATRAQEPEGEVPSPVAPVVDANGAITAGAACAWIALVISLLAASKFAGVEAEIGKPNIGAQYVAEFVGTFMLIFSVGCNVLVGDGTWGVVAIACTLMVMIYALGGISGGNFNPAVSVCLAMAGKMPMQKALAYVMIQLAAGVTAGLAYGIMLGKTFNLAPSAGFSGVQAGLAEMFYTFLLTFVVLNTACSRKHAGRNQFYGLAIGFSVVAGGYSGGAISGGCFNPAVALGIDASSSAFGFGWCFYYWAFEFVGCALAATLFKICRQGDREEVQDNFHLRARIISEFLGTFMLVLTVGLNVLAGSKAAVFSIAASLMCMIFALGSVSGAHFNPAVTIAIAGRGKCGAADAFLYIIVQLAGGVCAASTYSFMHSGKTVPLEPSGSFSQAMVGEIIFTFLLAYVVLSVATIEKPLSEYFGLAIGSCVTAGGLAIGNLSGGSLNPAVSAGLAFTHGGTSIGNFLPYAGAEIFGACIATTLFRVTHHLELTK